MEDVDIKYNKGLNTTEVWGLSEEKHGAYSCSRDRHLLTGSDQFHFPTLSGNITTAQRATEPDLIILMVLSKRININECFLACIDQIIWSHFTGIDGATILAHCHCSDRNPAREWMSFPTGEGLCPRYPL